MFAYLIFAYITRLVTQDCVKTPPFKRTTLILARWYFCMGVKMSHWYMSILYCIINTTYAYCMYSMQT